ncbi:type II secretion system F family protein [Falsiroseomonas sp.]|uniref:type II secretion system F family protein n=1 Tax=Falsiroseomonas sp. TaxID=2870721 RepID=UPI00356798F4
MTPTLMGLLSAGFSTLLLAGALLVLRGGGRQRAELRLARLVQRTPRPEANASEPVLDFAPTLELGRGQRILAKLGRSPYVPAKRRIPLPFILLAAAATGSLVSIAVAWGLVAFLALPAGIASGLLTVRLLFQREAGRHREALFQQVPDAMDVIVRAIRAGLPLNEALRSVAREAPSPTREEFEKAVAQLAIGVPAEQALVTLGERTGLPEYNFFVITVGLQAQTGGNLGETLANLSDLTRQRVTLQGRTRAITAEARLSAKIIVALPVVCGAAISLLKPGQLSPLFEDPFGRKLLVIGVSMLLTGILIMRGMLRNAVEE